MQLFTRLHISGIKHQAFTTQLDSLLHLFQNYYFKVRRDYGKISCERRVYESVTIGAYHI